MSVLACSSSRPAPTLNLWPTRVVWFRFPWSAVYITATSAWPPKSYSTERPQNQKRKRTHRDHHRNHSKRDCVFWRPARLTKRHLVTQDSRAYTQSRSCYDPERSHKISPGVFRVDSVESAQFTICGTMCDRTLEDLRTCGGCLICEPPVFCIFPKQWER